MRSEMVEQQVAQRLGRFLGDPVADASEGLESVRPLDPSLGLLRGCRADRAVVRLEVRGLVSRHADAADRRIKNVVATEEGRQAVRLIRADMRGTWEAFERLDEEGRRSLYELLGRLHPEDTQETT
ncbi:MarR family winged helix-turn-helix transcriptional regulator [Streptomyces venetus]|uniref:MarR family winged helix-turn-helix transcriptional regulator n=1 Tax=Streptomyces venetus TaxID=1701086 RepID=UPI003C3037E9